MPGTLLELVVAVAIQTVALSGLAAFFIAGVNTATVATRLANKTQDLIHVEHLIDSAASRNGRGLRSRRLETQSPPWNRVEFAADLDYDGQLDERSKERTAIAIASRGIGERGLVLSVGRQSVGIGPPIPEGAEIVQGFAFSPREAAAGFHWFRIPFDDGYLVATADIPPQ